MRWRLLERIGEFVPGNYAVAASHTNFPDELFADHFPSYPITPGVLLTEMGAQLSGILVQATVLEQRGIWIFPLLGMIERAKFRAPLPPGSAVEIRAQIEALRPEGAVCDAQILSGGRTCASMQLMLVFNADGNPGGGDPEQFRFHAREELRRLQTPWLPPGAAGAE